MKPVTIREPAKAEVLTGVVAPAAPAVIAGVIERVEAPVAVVLAPDFKRAEQWAEDIAFFHAAFLAGWGRASSSSSAPAPGPEVMILPELALEGEEDPRAFDLECDQLAALTRLHEFRAGLAEPGERLVLLTTPRALFQPVPRREELARREVRLRAGAVFPFQDLVDQLGHELGYDAEAVCETPGQFAVRGGLIDVYPVNATNPYRIDFFGDEVEDIRPFDPTTQRSEGKVAALTIAAPSAGRLAAQPNHLFDYLPEAVGWVFWEPAQLGAANPAQFTVPERIQPAAPTFANLFERREPFPDRFIGVAELDETDPLFGDSCARRPHRTEELAAYRTFVAESALGEDRVHGEQEARRLFLHQLLEWKEAGHAIHVVSHNEAEAARLDELLADDPALRGIRPRHHHGALNAGFRYVAPGAGEASAGAAWAGDGMAGPAGAVVVTGSEIFGRYRVRTLGLRRRRLPQRAQVDQLLDFSELAEGDYLVHVQHGICLYRGLTRMDRDGTAEDMISLEFDNDIVLHLPLHESHLISRYVGLAKTVPKLGRVGGNQWGKTRRAAEKATLDFAAELLALQAERDALTRPAYGRDTEWQHAFEEAFIYAETPDQMAAIVDAKGDLERGRPMDRLLCGDVGFGKTEVALRAVFKAVLAGRQAAVLAPTTVLTQQHFNTFRERFADYPLVVEMVSRFRTPAEQKKILAQLKSGRIDVVVGTHRLLSKDVAFRDLGLLVVDEEHRFGVRHKERIKKMRARVDILAMSATPIPRTLYLALVGARDLSVIETAPVDRLPIQTVVKSYDLDLVIKAVRREVERGGQVFYLHNRVQSIEAVAARLREKLPDLRIAVGHGQMAERDLEAVMTRFVAGAFDLLVCTTIIESGLDIPNCNTLIIEGADRFGLAQLYQLRGRVGRFKRQAYAYLLLHRHTHLLDTARKRLSAIRQYNQLGAGFKIAMRDLELRGAGNLLGPQQSGFIAGVGFDLYCDLLRQSIARLKGDGDAVAVRAHLRFDFVVVGEGENQRRDAPEIGFATLKEEELEAHRAAGAAQAYLPAPYLGETRLRIDFYRRLALATDEGEVDEIAAALEDRFGPRPAPVEVLLATARVRCLAEKKRILSVETEGPKLKLVRASGRPNDFVKAGARFPRLSARDPVQKLEEIRTFLRRLPSKTPI